ncbi:MAG: hypothetical protein QOE70_2976 [Chthoniobacter sp.]|jgi:hypothetical protein|nr:hypothetical protein [Chthoniobacter sp.]
MRGILLVLALALAGCEGVSVDLGTQQPLKVDIAMKLDVYQHSDAPGAKKTSAPALDVATTRRNRLSEIQALKNQRLIGENHAGYVEVRNLPPGKFGEYVRVTVDDENGDRGRLIERLAKEKNITVADAERQQAEIFRKAAFKDEWIEVPDAEGKFAWKQKE